MKNIEVVAAVIKKDDKILATQRGYGKFKGGWEFPGGKIEDSETKQEALKREIKEELTIDIEVGDFIQTVEYDYDDFHLTMHCYVCEIQSGQIELIEHEACAWLTIEDLECVNWLPADVEVVNKIKS